MTQFIGEYPRPRDALGRFARGHGMKRGSAEYKAHQREYNRKYYERTAEHQRIRQRERYRERNGGLLKKELKARGLRYQQSLLSQVMRNWK